MLDPTEDSGDLLYRQALVELRRGATAEAERLLHAQLDVRPQDFSSLQMLGLMALRANQPERAAEWLVKACAVEPSSATANANLGSALLARGLAAEAIGSFERAIAINPNLPDSHFHCGNAHFDLGAFAAARDCFAVAVALDPGHILAHNNHGLALWCMQQPEAAIASFDAVIERHPEHADAYAYKGHVLAAMKQSQAAIESFDAAVSRDASLFEAHNGRGSSLAALHRFDEAIESYQRAITLRPAFAEAHLNLGNVLADLQRLPEAIASYDRALASKPGLAAAHYKRGDALLMAGNIAGAAASLDAAVKHGPQLPYLQGQCLHARMQLAEWQDFDAALGALVSEVREGRPACHPFALLALCDSPELQQRCARIYAEQEVSASVAPAAATQNSGRIRIGYFAADFCNHPVSYLLSGIVDAHDRSAFEIHGYSLRTFARDDMRARLESGFDRFCDVERLSDAQVAELSRRDGIDIAVDLGGYTRGARPGIFGERAAPLQVSYLGFLATAGAASTDYLIADPTIVTPGNRPYLDERLIVLPSYHVNDACRAIAAREFSREELGLPAEGFVFCCFNALFKLTPEVFESWTRILKAVPESVLCLYAPDDAAVSNLCAHAVRCGLDPGRLRFAGPLRYPEYLARFRAMDLFLDTRPYNAGTTASDALYAGLPVLTCAGASFASRVAASVLNAAGVPELVTARAEEYEARAIELALQPIRLADLKARLSGARRESPLFNAGLFTPYLERGFRLAHARRQAGLPPADIEIPA